MKKELMASLLKSVKPNQILTKNSDLAYASIDRSTNLSPLMPKAVVRVHSALELKNVCLALIEHQQPLVIRGAGTGKSGGAMAVAGAFVVDVTAVNKILKIDTENLLAEVEPGVILSDLKKAAQAAGLFYPPDPASQDICTIGGNVAENAAGPSTLKYGSTRDYLLGGQAILGTGEVIDFGKRCPKGVAGYDLASLLCGSEGTLAVFTKFILQLLPLPQDHICTLVFFHSDEDALKAVNLILNHGHLPKILEFIDATCLSAVKKVGHFYDVGIKMPSALMIECDASYPGGAKHQLELIIKTLVQAMACDVVWACDDVQAKKMRRLREMLSEACTGFLGHKISEDIAVPLGALSDFGKSVRGFGQGDVLQVALFGHAGDGNLHVQIMFNGEEFRAQAEDIRHKILHLVISLGGTLTAEHGIGLQKKNYLSLEQSAEVIALQKRIKAAFDPDNLLNPGKIFV